MRTLILAVFLLLTVACDSGIQATVAHYGDSRCAFSLTEIGKWQVARDEVDGPAYDPRMTGCVAGLALVRDLTWYWLPKLAAMRERGDPQRIVVVLGANDWCAPFWDVQVLPGALDAFLDATEPIPTLWLREPAGTDCFSIPNMPIVTDEPMRIAAWNAELEAAVTRHPHLRLMDPTGITLLEEPGIVHPHFVHFDAAGRDRLGRIIVNALDELGEPDAPPQIDPPGD